ncbi:MAG: hypothetical protein ACP5D7_12515 [Limnospira sp.]
MTEKREGERRRKPDGGGAVCTESAIAGKILSRLATSCQPAFGKQQC